MDEKEYLKYVREHVQKCIILGRDWLKSEHRGYDARFVGEMFNEEVEEPQLPKYRISADALAEDIDKEYEEAFEREGLKENKALKEGFKLWEDAQEYINCDESNRIC